MDTNSFPSMQAILEADDHGLWVTTLKTAMELDIFEVIAKGAQTVEEIALAANCNPRGMSVLLDALCTKGLLDKSDSNYMLTPSSETYLIRSGQGYCLPIYLAWLQARDRFTDFVRTGKSALDLTSPDAEDLWVSYAAPDRVRLPELLELVNKRWTESGVAAQIQPGAHILDLGSGSGFKSFALLQRDATARVTAVDSPMVLEITKDIADAMGVTSQVTFQDGNTGRELPANTFDVAIIGNLVHYFDPDSAADILRNVRRAMKQDGILILYAKPVDEERKSDIALLSMIDISNCAPFGKLYTFSEYKSILEKAGFRDVNQPAIVLITARN